MPLLRDLLTDWLKEVLSLGLDEFVHFTQKFSIQKSALHHKGICYTKTIMN